MSRTPLKDRLYSYLLRTHGWMPSGDLQRIVSEKTSYTPQNVGRRLRELVTEGKLEVRYIKGAAQYRAKSVMTMQEYWDSLPNTEQRA